MSLILQATGVTGDSTFTPSGNFTRTWSLSGVSANSTLFFACGEQNNEGGVRPGAGQILSITDSSGGAWTLAAKQNRSGVNDQRCEHWYSLNVASGSHTITVTFDGVGDNAGSYGAQENEAVLFEIGAQCTIDTPACTTLSGAGGVTNSAMTSGTLATTHSLSIASLYSGTSPLNTPSAWETVGLRQFTTGYLGFGCAALETTTTAAVTATFSHPSATYGSAGVLTVLTVGGSTGGGGGSGGGGGGGGSTGSVVPVSQMLTDIGSAASNLNAKGGTLPAPSTALWVSNGASIREQFNATVLSSFNSGYGASFSAVPLSPIGTQADSLVPWFWTYEGSGNAAPNSVLQVRYTQIWAYRSSLSQWVMLGLGRPQGAQEDLSGAAVAGGNAGQTFLDSDEVYGVTQCKPQGSIGYEMWLPEFYAMCAWIDDIDAIAAATQVRVVGTDAASSEIMVKQGYDLYSKAVQQTGASNPEPSTGPPPVWRNFQQDGADSRWRSVRTDGEWDTITCVSVYPQNIPTGIKPPWANYSGEWPYSKPPYAWSSAELTANPPPFYTGGGGGGGSVVVTSLPAPKTRTNTRWVNPTSGSDSNNGQTKLTAWATVKAASVPADCTIMVVNGAHTIPTAFYDSASILPTGVTIRSESLPTLTSDSSSSISYVSAVGATLVGTSAAGDAFDIIGTHVDLEIYGLGFRSWGDIYGNGVITVFGNMDGLRVVANKFDENGTGTPFQQDHTIYFAGTSAYATAPRNCAILFNNMTSSVAGNGYALFHSYKSTGYMFHDTEIAYNNVRGSGWRGACLFTAGYTSGSAANVNFHDNDIRISADNSALMYWWYDGGEGAGSPPNSGVDSSFVVQHNVFELLSGSANVLLKVPPAGTAHAPTITGNTLWRDAGSTSSYFGGFSPDSSNLIQAPTTIVPVSVNITTPSILNAIVGYPYLQQIVAPGATSFSISGGPAWMSINATTGYLGGTPTSPASFSVTVTATNSTGSVSHVYTASSIATLFVGTTPPAATVGEAYSYNLSASAAVYSAAVVPAGMSLSTAGVLSGTPSAAGGYLILVSATATGSATITKLYSFTVTAAADQGFLTSSILPAAAAGLGYSVSILAEGTPTFSLLNNPSWLSITQTGVLSGTAPISAGNYTFTIRLTYGAALVEQDFTVTVNTAVSFNGIQNYNDLVAAIVNRTNRQDMAAYAPQFIAMCEGRINRTLRHPNMIVVNPAFAITGPLTPLPADFLQIEKVVRNENGKRNPMTFVPGGLETHYTDGTPDIANQYSIRGNNFECVSPSSATITLEITYYARIPSLATNFTNWLLLANPDVYLYGCLIDAAIHMQDAQREADYAARAAAAIQELSLSASSQRAGDTMVVRNG